MSNIQHSSPIRTDIIDDEIDICNNIKAILTDEGFNIQIAHNSDDALNLSLIHI